MLTSISDVVLSLWISRGKTKHTPAGWISGNAVCCHSRGEKPDNRGRGGLLITDNGFNYSCFNCGFKAGWSSGNLLSNNTRSLLKWLGMTDIEISKLNFEALRLKEQNPNNLKQFLQVDFVTKPLPDNSLPINTWIDHGCQDADLLAVIAYLVDERKVDWNWYTWYWSPTQGYQDRVIIPFYHQGKIVGHTARKITQGKPKYLTDAQPGYVFNMDAQHHDRAYIIVVEGQFDAIAIDGVAIMSNQPNEAQCSRINSKNREVVLVPDRDHAGANMIKAALEHNWSVSIPPWEPDIKDVADAVNRYGRLYTLFTILHYRTSNEIKIQLLKKKLESHNEQT